MTTNLLATASSTQKDHFTKRDGTTSDKYVSYIELDGTYSLELPLSQVKINEPLEYSILLWFKPQALSSKYQFLFEFSSSLECYFSGMNQIICDSVQKCDKLIVPSNNIQENQWSHISVMSHPEMGSTMRVEGNAEKYETRYISEYLSLYQQNVDSWNVCLGGCDSQYGFHGAFREFKILKEFITPDTASRIKNHYQLYEEAIIGYYRFQNDGHYFLKDEFVERYAKSSNNQTIISSKKEYIPNDICYPINEIKNFINFTDTQFVPLNFDQRWQPAENGWEYSLSLWIKPSFETCNTNKPSEARTSCFLVNLQDSFMIYMSGKNQLTVQFFNAKPYLETISKSIFIPQGQWLNIQLGANQYNGYDLRVYDLLGRQIGRVSEQKELYSQKVGKKTIQLFKNYQGIAKSFILYFERRALPLVMPGVNVTRNQFYGYNLCGAYFMFEPDYTYLENTVNASPKLINLCKHQTYGFLNATLFSKTTPIAYSGTYSKDYKFGQTDDLRGLIHTSVSLFDGIACEDGNMMNQMIGKDSFIKGQTGMCPESEALTIEMWLQISQITELEKGISYLLQVYSTDASQEVVSIKYDSIKRAIICSHYDLTSESTISFVNYNNYDHPSENQWAHLSCVFDRKNLQISGMLHVKDTFNEYQIGDITSELSNFKQDTYDLIMGNSNPKMNGTPSLKLREVRLFANAKTSDQIKAYRYRQINPSDFSDLISYYRLDEGTLNDYFNLVTGQTSMQSNGVQLVSDASLLVCPLGTYFNKNQTLCSQDLISNFQVGVYPAYNKVEDTVYWKFEVTTQLLSEDFADSININWSFEDQIIKSIYFDGSQESASNNSTLMIPEQAFRDNAKYKVRMNLSNDEKTFSRIQEITFVPVSCQYFLVDDQSSDSFYYNYTNQQSSENIVFTLTLHSLRPYCNEIAFFKDLAIQRLTYKMLADQEIPHINLQFDWDIEKKEFIVVLPKKEQYKIPLHTDVKFIFSIPWLNQDHDDIFPANNLTFQNAKITINFQKEGPYLVPSLETIRQRVFLGETAVFNASKSFIKFRENELNAITYTWLCPTEFTSICDIQQLSVLQITSKQFQDQSGIYEKSYTFKVKMSWNNLVNGTSLPEEDIVETSTIWFNVQMPSFTLEGPSGGVRVTSESNRFAIYLGNYEIPDLSILDIQWSIVPNASLAGEFSLTMNKTLLTLGQGALKEMTSYTIIVSLTNKQYSFAEKSQVLKFATSQAPSGGDLIVNPMIGFIEDTNFTVKLANWESPNKPIKYQVWSTQDSGGDTLSKQLTSSWMLDSLNFTFQAINSNPIIVLIKDNIGEQIRKKIVIMIQMKQINSTFWEVQGLQALKKKFSRQSGQSTSDRFMQMNSFVEQITNFGLFTKQNTTVQTNDTTTSMEEQINIVLDQIQTDIANIYNDSLSTTDKVIIVQKSVQIILSLTNTSQTLTSIVANRTVLFLHDILDALEQSEDMRRSIFPQDIPDLSQNDFVTNYVNVLSYLMNYTTHMQASNNQTINSRRRVLQTDTTTNDTTTTAPVVDPAATNNGDNVDPVYVPPTDTGTNDTVISDPNATDSSTVIDPPPTDTNTTDPNSSNTTETNNNQTMSNTTNSTNTTSNTSTPIVENEKYNQAAGTLLDVLDLKYRFTEVLCNLLQPDGQTVQNFETDIFDIQIEKFILSEQTGLVLQRSYFYTEDFATRVTYQVQSIADDIKDQKKPIYSFCLQTTFNHLPASIYNSDSSKNQSLISSALIESYIHIEPTMIASIDLQRFTKYTYAMKLNLSEVQLPTIAQCMGYSKSRMLWDEGMCKTTLNYEMNQVYCECTVIDNIFQGVFLIDDDNNREPEVEVVPKNTWKEMVEINYPFLSITLTMFFIQLALPAFVRSLDMRDQKKADFNELQFNSYQQKLNSKLRPYIAKNPSLRNWFITHPIHFNKESGALPDSPGLIKISFGKAFKLSHPFINAISLFESNYVHRLFRIAAWLMQISIFTILIVVLGESHIYGSKIEEVAQLWFSSETDKNRFIQLVVGVFGMLGLLPLPMISTCFRKLSKALYHMQNPNKLLLDDNLDNESKISQPSPPPQKRVGSETLALGGSEGTQTDQIENSKVTLKQGNAKISLIIGRILFLIPLGLAFAAVAMTIKYLPSVSLALQSSILCSYFIAIFGSILITLPLYALWQSLLLSLIQLSPRSLQYPTKISCTLFLDAALLQELENRAMLRHATLAGSTIMATTPGDSKQISQQMEDDEDNDIEVSKDKQTINYQEEGPKSVSQFTIPQNEMLGVSVSESKSSTSQLSNIKQRKNQVLAVAHNSKHTSSDQMSHTISHQYGNNTSNDDSRITDNKGVTQQSTLPNVFKMQKTQKFDDQDQPQKSLSRVKTGLGEQQEQSSHIQEDSSYDAVYDKKTKRMSYESSKKVLPGILETIGDAIQSSPILNHSRHSSNKHQSNHSSASRQHESKEYSPVRSNQIEEDNQVNAFQGNIFYQQNHVEDDEDEYDNEYAEEIDSQKS